MSTDNPLMRIDCVLHEAGEAVRWSQRVLSNARSYPLRNRVIRQNIEFTRSHLREALAELDAFEATVWPALASAVGETERTEA